MKRNLRKVNICRSPGGTPVVSEKVLEHGTGLTPMMTRALKKKFQVRYMCFHTSFQPSSRSILKVTDQVFSCLDSWPKRQAHKSKWKKKTTLCNLQYRLVTPLGSNRGRRFQFKQTFEFTGANNEILPTKLPNHSAHTN